MAGKAGGAKSRREQNYRRPNFAGDLNAALGEASRFMWRDIDNRLGPVIDEMEKVVAEVVQQANRELMRVRL